MAEDNPVLEAAQRRHVKQFSPRQISDDDWNLILEVARLAPSSFGLEHWRILDVRTPQMRETLKEVMNQHNPPRLEAARFCVFVTHDDLSAGSPFVSDAFIRQGMTGQVLADFLAGYGQFITDHQGLTQSRQMRDWAAKQAYIALAYMMLAAASLGIDSCPIEGFASAKAQQMLGEAGAIDPQRESVALMGAFGYRAAEPRPRSRRQLAEIVTII